MRILTILTICLLILSAATSFADEKNTGRIFGTVVDAKGNPVDGATVLLRYAEPFHFDDESKTRHVTTQSRPDGSFEIKPSERRSGSWTPKHLVAVKNGAGFVSVPLNARTFSDKIAEQERFVPPDWTVPQELHLVPGQPLKVFVRNRDGTPAPGLDVFLCADRDANLYIRPVPFGLPPVRADHEGVALIDWFPAAGVESLADGPVAIPSQCAFSTGQYPVNSWSSFPEPTTDYRELKAGVYRSEHAATDRPASLQPTITVVKMIPVTVLVKHENGEPASGITVRFFGNEDKDDVGDENEIIEFHWEEFETDGNGFLRGLVSPNAFYRLSVENDEYYARPKTRLQFSADPPPEPVEFVLKPMTKIIGTVRDLHPVDGREGVLDPKRPSMGFSCLRDVHVEVLDDPAEIHDIMFDKPHHFGFNLSTHGFMRSAELQPGRFEGRLPPGTYELSVGESEEPPEGAKTNPEIPSNARIITIAGRDDVHVDLYYLKPYAKIKPVTLRLIDGRTSQPLVDTEIRHSSWIDRIDGGTADLDKTDAEGKFVLRRDRFHLVLTTRRFQTADGALCALEEFEADGEEYTIAMKPPLSITGRILDGATRDPVPKTLVEIWTNPRLEKTYTDSDGRFTLKGLPADRRYTVYASDRETDTIFMRGQAILSNFGPLEHDVDLGDILFDGVRYRPEKPLAKPDDDNDGDTPGKES